MPVKKGALSFCYSPCHIFVFCRYQQGFSLLILKDILDSKRDYCNFNKCLTKFIAQIFCNRSANANPKIKILYQLSPGLNK